MRVVYIAGPFRGPTAWDIECNVRRAEEAALEVARAGAMLLVPHANTRFFHGQLDDKFWIDGTIALLRKSDAVLMIGEWTRSRGACGEQEEAKCIGLPVFYDIDEVKGYVASQ